MSYKMTQETLDKIKTELDHLKSERRPEIAEKIKEARSFGDLSENAEYDEAKNEQAKVEGRITELENLISNAELISATENRDIIQVSSKIKILKVKDKAEHEFTIVGSAEADISAGRISDESPIGMAFLGHKAGDGITAKTPAGDIEFKILSVE